MTRHDSTRDKDDAVFEPVAEEEDAGIVGLKKSYMFRKEPESTLHGPYWVIWEGATGLRRRN